MSCKKKQVRSQNRRVLCRDTANVEREMYGYTGNNWSHWYCNKGFKENLEAIPGKHLIDSLQQTAVLGTSHVIRKVLQCETAGSGEVQ
jgi:hypothetical protein